MKSVEELQAENATLKAQIAKSTADLASTRKELAKFRAQYEVRRLASTKFHLKPGAADAIDDAASDIFEIDEKGKLITRESAVSPLPGLSVDAWMTDFLGSRQYMLAEKDEGSRRGVRNPFTHENWNLSEQGRIFNEDAAKAERLAAAAGTKIGGPRPAAKAAV